MFGFACFLGFLIAGTGPPETPNPHLHPFFSRSQLLESHGRSVGMFLIRFRRTGRANARWAGHASTRPRPSRTKQLDPSISLPKRSKDVFFAFLRIV